MNATIPQALPTFKGYPVNFYTERLSDFDVEYLLPQLVKFCLTGCSPSELLAAYLGAVRSFEQLRRDAIAGNSVIIEAQLPVVPAHCWSGPELGKALSKAISLATATSGELNNMVQHILNCIVAETQVRLGLTD